MPPANAIQKKRSFEPIDTYLHLLSGQTPTPENWDAAAELIHAGMATGHVHRSSTTAAGEIDALVAFAPTLQGRLYAQQLQENKRARGVIGRLQKYLLVLLGWVGGVLSAASADLLNEATKRALGW